MCVSFFRVGCVPLRLRLDPIWSVPLPLVRESDPLAILLRLKLPA